jgi:hypothetical protein
MGIINKGLAPMNKTAVLNRIRPILGTVWNSLSRHVRGLRTDAKILGSEGWNAAKKKVGQVGQMLKDNKTPASILGAGAIVGAPTAYGMSRMGNAANEIKNTVTQGKEDIQNEIAQGRDAALNEIQKFTSTAKNPFMAIANQFGGGLAGMMGIGNYASPQWYSKLVQFLYNLFGKQAPDRFNNVTASYTKEGSALTTYAALDLALHGSNHYHKQASAGEIIPDRTSGAHICLAIEMEKLANYFASQKDLRYLALPFFDTAEKVREGHPAKVAMFERLGNEHLAEQACAATQTIAADILGREIVRTLNQKTAELLAKKHRCQ